MPFSCPRLEIPDVILIEAKNFADERGSFLETYEGTRVEPQSHES